MNRHCPRWFALCLVAAAALMGCGEVEGPAVEVFLQLAKADPALDTSDVTGFLVRVNDEAQAIQFNDDIAISIPFLVEPAAGTSFVVFACKIQAGACNERFAEFVGCVVEDIAPSTEPLSIRVLLSAIDPLPPSCAGLVTPQ